MVPKFLHADDGESDREFVIHTEEPRVLIEFTGDSGEIVQWFDEKNDFMSRSEHVGKEPSDELARLLRKAGEFFLS
jgi:hypothetical protein